MDNKKVIILVRHGNTELNAKKAFRGHIDVPLDKTGITQAEKTGKFLESINIDTIFSSPLSRAFLTAEIIAKYQKKDVPIFKEEGFNDLDFGEWEGKTYEEVKLQYPEIYKQWASDPFKAIIPGGGTMKSIQEKSWESLNNILKNNDGSIIGIVTHRIVNKVLISSILGIGEQGIWKINQDPCCINVLEYNYGTLFVSKLNFNYHITDIKDSFFNID